MAWCEWSNQIYEGTELRVKEPFVGPDCESIGHSGDMIAQKAGTYLRILCFANAAFRVGREEINCRVGSLDIILNERAKESPEQESSLMLELVELRGAEDEVDGDVLVEVGLL